MVYGWFKLLVLIDVVVRMGIKFNNEFIIYDVCKLFMKTIDMLECPPQPLTLHKTIVWCWDSRMLLNHWATEVLTLCLILLVQGLGGGGGGQIWLSQTMLCCDCV